jgi:hypothetical protein
MLTYSGFLTFDCPLTDHECDFLNEWQNLLNDTYQQREQQRSIQEKDIISQPINDFLGINLDQHQLWTIFWGYNPLISFTKEGINIEGSTTKGQLREALLSYEFLFLGEQPIFKNTIYEQASFLTQHNFEGYIQSKKKNRQWCYLIEKNSMYSVNAKTIEQYLTNPEKFPKTLKEDTFSDKFNKYFSKEFIAYSNLNAKLISSETKPKAQIKKNKI